MGDIVSDVASFYSKKTILFTGGSGYIGQVMVEKLLYSCKEIDKIYILIRPKKHSSPAQRIEAFTNDEIFTRLRSERPEALKKIKPIEGEMSLPNLGLSISDQQVLIENVSVVFHVAATIRFDEPIKTAVNVNVEGTLQLLELSKRIKKLEAFVHVSTAFCNITQRYIKERVYPPPATLDEVYRFIKENQEEDVQTLLGKYPNTYAFTKAIAEYELTMNRGDCPVSIVRPSIVLSVYKEPIEGWINNWNGPTAILYHASRGIFRFMTGDGDKVTDIIPADIAANMTIVAATACKKSNGLKVYNCCSGPRNPLTWFELHYFFTKKAVAMGHNELPFPSLVLLKSSLVVDIINFLVLTIPMFFMDCWQWITGKPPIYLNRWGKIKRMEKRMNFATSEQWDFEDGNVRKLIDSMSPVDRELFYCDPQEIQWRKYVEDYYMGVWKYLLKK